MPESPLLSLGLLFSEKNIIGFYFSFIRLDDGFGTDGRVYERERHSDGPGARSGKSDRAR